MIGLYLCRRRPEFTLSEVEGLPDTCGAGALAREMAVYVIYPHDHWPSRPCQPRKPLQPVPLQLRRSHILQPGTSVPGTLPHRDQAPIGRNLTVTKRKRPRWLRIWPLFMPATTGVYP